jgi:hypothetical protein
VLTIPAAAVMAALSFMLLRTFWRQ